MSLTTTTTEDHDRLLDEVLARYLRAVQAGQAPSREALGQEYPMLARELERFFADQDHVERAAEPLRQILPPRVPLGPGCMLGDYELLEEIAQGGMGVVWKARQKSLGRVVAVKVLRSGRLPARSEWERFRIEAQAVAALDHPGIVPIYEVGEHDGLPFFSMKYVEGGSLARQRSRFQAAPREAARLVALVARAVHHAHERGVLHRDLKPANVLLNSPLEAPLAGWQPIVTDFGLAKRIAAALPEDATVPDLPTAPHLTSTGAILGTPVYVAPEQARGEGPTTATDVYGLGVILYELLTGQQPFSGEAIDELLRRIQDEPPRPPRSLNSRVDHDLEAIVLACLRKRPEERYPTAAAVADDLDRYWAAQPVSVRRISKPRRLWLWCRRQPVIAGLTAALLLLAVTGYVLVLAQWRRAEANFLAQRSERERAEGERTRAEGNLDRLEELLDDICSRLSEQKLAAAPGFQPVRKQFLDAGLKHYQEVLAQRSGNPRLRSQVALTHYRISVITAAIGSRADALASCRRALDLYEELHEEVPDNTDILLHLAQSAQRVGVLQSELGHGDDAAVSFRRGLEVLEKIHDGGRPAAEARSIRAAIWHDTGNLHFVRGEAREALVCFQKKQALHEEELRAQPNSRWARYGLAVALTSSGNVYESLGDRDKYLRCLEQARQLLEALNQEKSEDHIKKILAANSLRIGSVRCVEHQWDASLKALQPARDLLTELVQDNPKVLPYQDDLANVQLQMGHAYRESKRYKEATECYRAALNQEERLHRADPSSPAYRRGLARGCFDLASVLVLQNRYDEALPYLLRAGDHFRTLSTAEPKTVDHHRALALTLNNIAVLKRASKPAEAVVAAREAAEHGRTMMRLVPDNPQGRELLSTSYRFMADLERRVGRPDASAAASLARHDLYPEDPVHVYQCARELALTAAAIRPGNKDLSEAEQARRNEYLDSAMRMLNEAIRKGWKDVEKLEQDDGWKGLRQRDDFRKLLEALKH
jgi:serine/threonine-protein kinase